MKNLELDYNNEYQVRNYINTTVLDQISEDLKEYSQDEQQDAIFDIISGLSDVVYSYQAKRVAEAFGLSPFGYSEISGDRYDSFSEMAFEVIFNAYNTH
jgi:hypothetical protein